MADAARDGLMRRPSKLSRDEIAQIKFLAKSMNKSELARLYKVHRQTISAIIADTPFRQLRKRAKNKS